MNKFIPREGQTDFTNVRRAPVVNCVVQHKGKILIVQRSEKLNFYPNCWNGVSGFLDDGKSVPEKAEEELWEELGIARENIISMTPGGIFEQEEEKYQKTWIVHPVLAEVSTDKVSLDWEAKKFAWVDPDELANYDLLPGFERVLAAVGILPRQA